jgi:hypothetical protein
MDTAYGISVLGITFAMLLLSLRVMRVLGGSD